MYRYKIDNKKSLIVCIVFFSIFIALTIRLYILMIYPTTSVQGQLENNQVGDFGYQKVIKRCE